MGEDDKDRGRGYRWTRLTTWNTKSTMTDPLLPLDVSAAQGDRLCWSLALPAGLPPGDSSLDVGASPLCLYEDGVALGPPHSLHDDIRRLGGGRFSHWGGSLYFSASDNSDPRGNGRAYAISAPGLVATDAVAIAAGYQLSVAEAYLELLRQRGVDPTGKTVLELGPGENLGAQLLLAGTGATMVVADRYPARWDDANLPLYRLLAATWHGPVDAVNRAIAGRGFDGVVRVVAQGAEAMADIADGSVDVVLSNAVLEHVEDLARAAAELKRVSAPGALHLHQVDFRDHADLTRPLEHLLIPADRFQDSLRRNRWERGCQTRPAELRQIFAAVGFAIVEEEVNSRADAAYLDDFMARLERSASPYAGWSRDRLVPVGVRLVLRA
jgi:SAM-dependent methyltransferase